MLKKIIAFLILVLVLVIPTQVAHALNVPPAPSQTAILDQARVIDDAKEAEISQKLIDYKSKTGNEIAVLTIQSLKGEEAFDYSHRVASEWGVGSKEANNGVLLFVAAEDRQIFIQVGRGLEPSLTDLQSSLIIRQKITPEFKKGDYTKGISDGIDSIISVIGGERLSGSVASSEGSSYEWISYAVVFGFMVLSYIGSFLARTKSWWAGGVIGAVPGVASMFWNVIFGAMVLVVGVGLGLLLDYFLSKNYKQRLIEHKDTTWWGSGGGFFGGGSGGIGGSGGGFGGFGGGSFGGGGSGGSW